MRLKHVRIKCFRSIKDLELDIDGITTLIGKNGAGKSNVLRALRAFFFASDKSLVPNDISTFAEEGEDTWIECSFADLTPDEQTAVGKYLLHDGSIQVRRTMEYKEDKLASLLHGWIEEPSEEWLQADYPDYQNKTSWQKIGVDPFDYADRPSSGRITREILNQFQEAYITQHRDTLTFTKKLSPTQFMGRQATGLKALPLITFIPATGDVAAQIVGSASGLINTLVKELLDKARDRDEYVQAEQALRQAERLINPSDRRLEFLGAIEDALEEQLGAWGKVECTISTAVEDLSKVLLSGLTLRVDDGTETDLAQKGEGIQRQILFQVFRIFADFRSRRGIFRDMPTEVSGPQRSHIIIFEEPELYLHPQAQERFYDDLVAVSETDQVVLSTHSTHLVRLEYADGVKILTRSQRGTPTEIFQAQGEWVNDRDERDELKDIQLLTSDISKMFFADKIILVEGAEDYVYVVGTARDKLACYDARVAVVSAGNKENIPRLQRILNGFRIPYIVVYDKDPDNIASERTTAKIVRLVSEGTAHGATIDVWECDPDLASVCGNNEVTDRDKPYQAYLYLKNNDPAREFLTKVREIFAI